MTGDHERRKRDYLTKAVHLPSMQVSCLAHISQVGKLTRRHIGPNETAIRPVCRHRFHLDETSPTWTLNLFRFSLDLVGTSLVLVDGSRRHREPPTHLCAWNNASPLCDDDSAPQEHKIRNRLNPKLSGERRALLRVDLED
jgi:hypothetical protein